VRKENVPAAQAVHAVAPLPLHAPSGHGEQAAELESGAKDPAAQGRHAEEEFPPAAAA
jgi:hypothetical protein